MSCEPLWGEISPGSGLGKAEREELCKLPQIPILEGPKLYQPQTEQNKLKREYPTDDLVQNNIRLLQYKRQLVGMLEILGQRKANIAEISAVSVQPELPVQPPPLPQLAPVRKCSKVNFTDLQSVSPTKDDIDIKHSFDAPEVSRYEYLSLLRKSVIQISAHAGYTNAMESSLSLLTEAAEMFIQNISKKLRAELDRSLESNEDGNGWSDILEKVLVESGIGGVLQLQDYHENYVVKYNTRLHAQCKELEEMYTKEMNACLESGQDNIPEMHFPSSDEGAGESLPNLATPTLDVGMQMLQSLEAASVDLGEEAAPLSNQSEMAFSVQSCPTPSPALTPRQVCPTPSPAFTPRPLHAPSPQLPGGSAKKRRRSGGKFI